MPRTRNPYPAEYRGVRRGHRPPMCGPASIQAAAARGGSCRSETSARTVAEGGSKDRITPVLEKHVHGQCRHVASGQTGQNHDRPSVAFGRGAQQRQRCGKCIELQHGAASAFTI